MSGSNRFVNFSLINDTNDSIPCEKTVHFRQPFITIQNEYEVAITKLRIPTTNLELLRTSDTTDEWVSFSIASSPTYTVRHQENLPPTSLYPVLSLHDWKERLNLTMAKGYKTWMSNLVSPTSSIVYSHPYVDGTPMSINVTNTASTSCNISLRLINLDCLDSQTPKPMKLTLSSPSGASCVVANNLVLPMTPLGPQTLDITFDDTSLNEQPVEYIAPGTTCRSLSGFGVLNDEPPNGTWSLSIEHAHTSHIVQNLEFTVELIVQGTYFNCAAHPPTLSFSNDDGFLSISYPEKFMASGTTLAFSPAVHTVTHFDCVPRSPPGETFVEYALRFDHSVLSTELDQLITRRMEKPSIEVMSNIVSILVTSSNLLTQSEMNADETSSHTVSSFSPDFSRELGVLHYDASSYPYRSYPMLSQGELNALDIGVQILYATGEVVNHTLSPREKAFFTLMFIKRK